MTETRTTTTGGLALTAAKLVTPPIHIPNETGGSYKTELVLERDPKKGTVKILWWHEDDPRPEPHNHPWDFTSDILGGGYTELRYWIGPGNVVLRETKTYRVGDRNVLPRTIYHVVTNVLPGTVTRLICGEATPGNKWGYLNIETGVHTEAEADPGFIDKLRALNPHLRQKG